MKLRSSNIEQTMPATLSQFAAFGIVLKSMHALSFCITFIDLATTHCLSTPNLLWDMAGNSRPCLQRMVQGRITDLLDLNTRQQEGAFETLADTYIPQCRENSTIAGTVQCKVLAPRLCSPLSRTCLLFWRRYILAV